VFETDAFDGCPEQCRYFTLLTRAGDRPSDVDIGAMPE